MKEVDVLVVGAGPTGLALAALLGKAGVNVKVIDKGSQRSTQSKALGVQAGTLEAIEDLFSDLPQKMIRAGRPAQSASIHFDQKSPIQVRFDSIPSRYNCILILAQSETERLLEEECAEHSVFVERQCELIAIDKNHESEVLCQIRSQSGDVESIRAKYLVGCDGAHSSTRHLLEIPFAGGAYEGEFVLGDVQLVWPWSYDQIRVFISKNGAMACFPMNGERQYRLILIPKKRLEGQSRDISLDAFRKMVLELAPKPVEVLSSVWLTRFSVHHRIVNALRKGNVFLAGDAAHIHSPAGGQGMNTGIQDSFNLGSKLIQVLKYGADVRLLDQYEVERLPIAKQVLFSTDVAFRLILSKWSWLERMRNFILPILLQSRFVQRQVSYLISEVGIARKERPQRLAAIKENPADPILY